MKKLSSLLFVLSFSLASFGQSAAPNCGTKTYKDLVSERTDITEDQKQVLLDAFELTQQAFNKQIRQSSQKSNDTTYIIPVVFHIIHQYGQENVPNQTIHATINLLNREFSKTNSPIDRVVPPFNTFIGNVNVEFRLATIDPEGNCTNGIIRHVDPMAYCNTLACNMAVKAKYRWPREQYMNCHVVGSIQTSGGGVTQGFSHFPFFPFSLADSIDANAMIYSVLPTNLNDQGGGNTSVTSHEVGHWLGLYHTWGKTDNVADPASCNEDDDVSDTPNCIGLRSVCDLQSNTCNKGLPNDTIDNTQNFMDYSHCYAMFTEGQAQRMRGVLENVPHRKPLITAANLALTGTDYIAAPSYLCAADFTADRNYEVEVLCPGQSISFSDLSFHGVSSRKWSFEGGNPVIGTDSIETVTYNQPGEYSVTLEVKDANNTRTITRNKIIRVIAADALGGSYSQDFESINLSTDTDFEINNPDGDAAFEVTTVAGFNSAKALVLNNFNTTKRGRVDELISNTMDLSGKPLQVIDFKYAFAGRLDSITSDELGVFISTDCGRTWAKRKSLKAASLKSAPDLNTAFVPGNDEWKSCVVPLSTYSLPNIRFKIEFISGGGNNLYIDDFHVYSVSGLEEQLSSMAVNLAPNPSNQLSELTFYLPSSVLSSVTVTDLTGRLVAALIDGVLPAGENSISVPTSQFKAGVYLVTLSTNGNKITKKLLVE